MKRLLVALALLSAATTICPAAGNIVWQLGSRDGSAHEFALYPDRSGDFVKMDFGWEDKFFLVGHSDPSTDIPYVLPSVADAWAGSGGLAGDHAQVVNILFDIASMSGRGSWELDIDLVDTHSQRPPLLKVTVNGFVFKHQLPKGGSDASITGDYSNARPYHLAVEIPAEAIRTGNNEISIMGIEGSWIILDAICLIAPAKAVLAPASHDAYVRDVAPANYASADGKAQPLLVNVEHLTGEPELEVRLDGKRIYTKTLEQGHYCLEVPMPAVTRETKSRYDVRIDGRRVRTGTVIRRPCRAATPADYVDTRMGTAHSRWMLAPGPWMPFSMVKISPDNQGPGWQGGYDAVIESVGTFSHIHEWTMAGLGTMPTSGKLEVRNYRSAMDKATEVSECGYYSVKLTDHDILAELTATDRCSFQRYTYADGETPRVLVDYMIPAEYGYRIEECSVEKTGPRRIEGHIKQFSQDVWSSDADQYYTINYVMEFDHDIKAFGGWSGKGRRLWNGESQSAKNPGNFGCYIEFAPTEDNTVQVRTGLSFVDLEGARGNLAKEITGPFGWSFDAVVENQRKAWNEILGRIVVKSDDRKEKVRFYTNLYRSFCRNTYSDVDGRWMSQNDIVRQLDEPDARAMGCDAFWNTFWNLNQVWNLVGPEWSSRWVRSQLAMYDSDGWLAKGPAGMKYIPVMVAEHEIPLLVGAYQMGIRDFDASKVLEAACKMQTTPAQNVGSGFAGNRDLQSYLRYHFVPCDLGRFSNTLEYSYDDWTISQLALALGRQDIYETYSERGTWWKNAIDPETGFARMRYSDGHWEQGFDPFRSGANHHYVEGNAWQLTAFVPQDIPGLAEIIGRERFLDRIEKGFQTSETYRYNAPGEGYWDYPVVQGNQQSMQFAFLFNWLEQPWNSQKWARSIMDRYYGCGTSNAWLGDEDQGQMSAWFVMAAIGLFQTDGGCSVTPHYEIVSPLFEEIEINLGGLYGRGDKFIIRADGCSRKNMYVQSAELNGKPHNSFLLDASDVLKGGELRLKMSSEPSMDWGLNQ